jgi:hypothetical protein
LVRLPMTPPNGGQTAVVERELVAHRPSQEGHEVICSCGVVDAAADWSWRRHVASAIVNALGAASQNARSDHFCPDCREWEGERICPNLPPTDARGVHPMVEPRCVGHVRGAGYSHYGLAKNCPHAECKALAEAAQNASYTVDGDG